MKNKACSSSIFWDTAQDFIYHQLPDIRRLSQNTVLSYRDGLNHYIDFLETQKHRARKSIAFSDFDRGNLKDYLDWMLNKMHLSPKTCNLRLTGIRTLLEYASAEHDELMPTYVAALRVKGAKISAGPIEYFEPGQMAAVLAAPDTAKKTGRRNQMLLILMYDTGARVSEILDLKVGSLHLDSQIPYVTILGKGRKYRNIPLTEKTLLHLKRYFQEFQTPPKCDYLFYASSYNECHRLSVDSVSAMLKKYAATCVANGIEMPSKIHCHMVRKTRAMDLYRVGVPLTHIQQLLGHENLSTTGGFYAFVDLKTLDKSLQAANGGNAEKKWDNKEIQNKLYRL